MIESFCRLVRFMDERTRYRYIQIGSVLLGGKIMVQDYMFTIYSYALHQLCVKSYKPKLHIYNNRTKCQYKYTCSIKMHINIFHIFVLINIQCVISGVITHYYCNDRKLLSLGSIHG
jgi:hypothetical protein